MEYFCSREQALDLLSFVLESLLDTVAERAGRPETEALRSHGDATVSGAPRSGYYGKLNNENDHGRQPESPTTTTGERDED
ncbi:MAG: hypothetical protein M3346_02775 [Actinomycetota bacterium]|nr:hypothetical protein [Actinomycetota bacterium]